jgi:hypothetical protein
MLISRLENASNHPTNANIAVGLGNQLHIVVSHFIESPAGTGNWVYDIFYFQGQADAPRLEPQVLTLPTTVPLPIASERPKATAEPVSSQPTASVIVNPANAIVPSGGGTTLGALAGVIPALLFVGGVVAARLLRRRI